MRAVNKNTYAVSEVISSVVAIMIVMSAITAILFWGRPYLDRLQSDASMETMFNQLSVVTESAQNMVLESSGSVRQHEVFMYDGILSTDSQGDRFVLMYSFNDAYNFTVDGLNDNDKFFNVTIHAPIPTGFIFGSATAYWFDEEPSSEDVQIPSSGDLINYTNIKFNWSGIGSAPYVYMLKNYSIQQSSNTIATSKIYYNLPDSNTSYQFIVYDKDGVKVKNIIFSVIEGCWKQEPQTPAPTSPPNTYNVTYSSVDLTGTVRIDLWDSGNKVLFGRIFLFDLGLVDCTFQSSAGSYKNIMENNGILSIGPNGKYLRKEPILSLKNNVLTFNIMQIRNQGLTTSIEGLDTSWIRLAYRENYIRQMLAHVYKINLQVYGPYEEIWLTYFKQTYGFTEIDDNTIQLSSFTGEISLSQTLYTAEISGYPLG